MLHALSQASQESDIVDTQPSARHLLQAPLLRSATVALAASNELAVRAIQALSNLLLDDATRQGDLASQISPLETAVGLHGAALHIALNAANPSTESVRKALQADHELAGSGGGSIQLPAVGTTADSAAPTASSINDALRSHHHKALCAFVKGLDLETTQGIVKAIGEAFNGTMLLPVRVLFTTSPLGDPIAKRDETLARLNDLRSYMTSYLEHSIRIDPSTGLERESMRHYHLTDHHGSPSPFVTAFLDLTLDKVPWIDAPHGLLGYQHRLNSNERAAHLPSADHFCIPAVMEELADFAQKLFSAIGMDAVVNEADGYSMEGFCRFYAKHLKLAGRLESREEKLKWLEASVSHWHSALALAGSTLRALVFSSNVATLNLASFRCARRPNAPAASPAFFQAARPLFRADSPPVQDLLKMQTALATAKSIRASTDIYGDGGGGSSTVAYEDVQLPRLSSLKRSTSGSPAPSQPRSTKQKATSQAPPLPRAASSSPTPKAADGTKPSTSPHPPGSLVKSWRYTNGGKILIVSGRAWNLPPLAKHLGVRITDVCWPYALCLANSDASRPARCDKFGKANHGAHGTGAHISLDLTQLDNFWRPATDEEKRGLWSVTQLNKELGKGKGPSKGKGSKGGKGRGGRGRGRGRGGHLDFALDDYAGGDGYSDYSYSGYGLDDYSGGDPHYGWGEDPEAWPEDSWPDEDILYEEGEEAYEEEDDGGAAFYSLVRRSPGRQGDLPSSSAALPSPPRFALLGRGLLSLRAGRSDPAIAAPIDSLPSPKALPSAATQRNVLHSPMRTLAAHVQNEGRLLVDVGGRGQCGPNTLSFQIGLLDPVLHFGAPDGPALRSACCKHIMDKQVQRRLTSLNDEYGFPMMLGPLVINTMLQWPQGSTDLEPSIENWCDMISRPETWTDIAFLQIVSDLCQVAIHVTGVSDLSEIVPDMLLILPCNQQPPKALLRVGYWLDRHLVAIVDVAQEKGAAPADLPDGSPPPPPCPPPPAEDLDEGLVAALVNSEITLEEDAIRRAIRLTAAAAETESERNISAVEIQTAIERSLLDEAAAARARTTGGEQIAVERPEQIGRAHV